MGMPHSNQYVALLNAENEIVGLFRSTRSEQAARAEWDQHYAAAGSERRCRSVRRVMVAKPLAEVVSETVERGDGERADLVVGTWGMFDPESGLRWTELVGARVELWLTRGAESVDVRRYILDAWRRPGKGWLEADLGGLDVAAVTEPRTVLYRLVIKAPAGA